MPRSRIRRSAARTLAGLSRAEPEQADRMPDVDFRSNEDGGPEGSEELSGQEKYRVEIHLFQTRPQDSDNSYTKAIVDQMRYHGLIPQDDPRAIKVYVRQWKVKHRNQEGTRIVIRKQHE